MKPVIHCALTHRRLQTTVNDFKHAANFCRQQSLTVRNCHWLCNFWSFKSRGKSVMKKRRHHVRKVQTRMLQVCDWTLLTRLLWVEVCDDCLSVDMPVASRGTYLRWTIGRSQYGTWGDFTLSVTLFDLLTALIKNNRQLLIMVDHTLQSFLTEWLSKPWWYGLKNLQYWCSFSELVES